MLALKRLDDGESMDVEENELEDDTTQGNIGLTADI